MSNTTNNNTTRRSKTLKIWQQNVNKSKICQYDMLASGRLATNDIDIIALQEPHINHFSKTIATRDWVVIYPSTHEKDATKIRSLLMIRDNIIMDDWEQLEFQSSDVSAARLKGEWGQLVIFNIYNDCTPNDTLNELTNYHNTFREDILGNGEGQEDHHLIWLGDFNRHHPCWDTCKNNTLFTKEAMEQAEILIHILADFSLDLALPSGIPTHKHNITKCWSRLDQVFAVEHTIESVITCEALPNQQGPNTDHFPILTVLSLEANRTMPWSIRNFRDVDWEEFKKVLADKVKHWGVLNMIKTQSELDHECMRLMEALQKTIEEKVPETRLGPQCRRWWTKELASMRKVMLKWRRKAYVNRQQIDTKALDQFKEARRKYSREIERIKRNHWRDWLEKASDPDLWTAQRYLNAPASDRSKTRIPDLKFTKEGQQHSASTNTDKGEILARTFFPDKPKDAQMGNEEETIAPAPVDKMGPITEEQIQRQLTRLKPYKVPGPDGIPNIVLTKCTDILAPRLGYIFAAIMNRKYYYMQWKISTTVVLRKPGKPQYDMPKAYRPITLLNTMGKVLTVIIAESLTYYIEKHNLLPPTHFGGRPARTTNDTIHYLIYKIKDAWRKRQVTSVLFLDIEGAFPNAVNEQLVRNLSKRRVPTKIVNFVDNMLKSRMTCLKFNDFTSQDIHINNGIGQGDLLSMVLYQFYNTDILDTPNGANEAAVAYVDDTILIATAKTFAETHNMLTDMMKRQGGAMEWAKTHNSTFELMKLVLIDFTHQSKKVERKTLKLEEVEIAPMPSTRYLGVLLDQNLNWKEQEANAVKKGTIWTAQIRRAVRSEWGLTPKHAKRLYTSITIPRTFYAIDVWCPPPGCLGSSRTMGKLRRIQHAGTLAITGGLRTTPTDLLDVHTNLLPTHLEIDKHCARMAVRSATLPAKHLLTKYMEKCARQKVCKHKLPLHLLAATYGTDPQCTETISTAPRDPTKVGRMPFKIERAKSKDKAKDKDESNLRENKIYTDGSAHGGNVRVVAVLMIRGRKTKVLRYRLGTIEEHTVFEAEVVGILLRLHLIKTEVARNAAITMGIDNQAILKALKSRLNKAGHHLASGKPTFYFIMLFHAFQ